MIAENKQEFFEQLNQELERLGVEDSAELIADLNEHFAESERRGVPESETCRELGSIAEIARSCLDLKSEAINSMVARDVVRKKVSLTKPGRSTPADPSLAAAPESEQAANEDCVRSYTPEHIAEEVIPSTPTGSTGANIGTNPNGGANIGTGIDTSANESTSAGGSESANSSTDNSNGSASSQSGVNIGATSGSAEPQAANSSESGGVFEKIGRTVDAACDRAGEAVNKAWNKAESALNKAGTKINGAAQNFRPSDSYRENVNKSKHAEVPPQMKKVKTKGGGKFIDVSGLKPNVNGERLIFVIILDILLWIWLIPTVFALAISFFGGALGLVGVGIVCVFGKFEFAQYHFVTRILFTLGFCNLAALVFMLGTSIIKGAISLAKYVIERHIKAIYDI